MKRIIIKSLELIATILMALIVLGAAIGGAASGGFIGFLGGLIAGAITAIVLLGALFLLMDIADNTRRTAELLERQQQP